MTGSCSTRGKSQLRRRVGRTLALAGLFGLAVAPSTARADDAEAARISAAGHSLRWNWTPPGHTERFGHAETLVHAPLSVVRARVVDYSRYREFLPDKFKTSRVVGHSPDGSADVYMQISVMHGVVTLWDITRFAPPKTVAPGVDVVEGRMMPGKGNVDDLDALWTLRAIDPEWTVLKFDLLLRPGLFVPQWVMDEELRDSAACAIDAIHDRAQGSTGIAPWGAVAGAQ
jgi:hypothetical protein